MSTYSWSGYRVIAEYVASDTKVLIADARDDAEANGNFVAVLIEGALTISTSWHGEVATAQLTFLAIVAAWMRSMPLPDLIKDED